MVSEVVDNRSSIYAGGAITNMGNTISKNNIQLVIQATKEYNVKPSFLIAQMFIESHWGNPNISIVSNVDNNWSGISEPFNVPSDLGITISRGSARPANEGGYYIHFSTVKDFFKAYAFVLSKRNGLYNVENATTIETYCKGLFRVGGAKADYAVSGYQHYLEMLVPTYNAIKQQNPGKLEAIDSTEEEKPKFNLGVVGMFIYIYSGKMMAVWGNKRFHLNNMDKVGHFKAMVKNYTGNECKEYRFENGSEQVKTIESFTDLQKTSL